MQRASFAKLGLIIGCGLTLGSSDGRISVQAQIPAEAEARPRAISEKSSYRSPYRVEFRAPRAQLIADIEQTERGDPRLEAEIPHSEWYAHHRREHLGSWGPHPRTYPPPEGVARWPVEMQRERVIAVAQRFLGYAYQHHHIPDWDPPRHWPWKKSCAGENGRGVDCSNFTGFVYNLGFGLRLNTEVHHQAEERFATGLGQIRVPIKRIELPKSYEERIATLRTGDLVFIRNHGGKISHVVLWVGEIGKSPDSAPLIIDSHGEDVHDSNGHRIPCGIRLRPFHKHSWYNTSASHASRIIQGN